MKTSQGNFDDRLVNVLINLEPNRVYPPETQRRRKRAKKLLRK